MIHALHLNWIPWAGTALLLLGLVSGCSPVDPEFSRYADREKSGKPAGVQTPTLGSNPSTPAETTDRPDGSPPDWEARRHMFRSKLEKTFTPPVPGQEIRLVLKSGSEKTGQLVEATSEHLILQMPGATITYPKEALGAESRLRFIQEDYVNFHANRKVREEQQAYEAKQARLRAERELARLAALGEAPDLKIPPKQTEPSIALPHLTVGPPVNDPTDASVQQVKDYLQKNTRQADTIRYLEWSRVVPHPDGFSVRCMYRVDTESFGTITENKVFYMNKAGRVVNVSGGTQTVRKLDL